MFRVEEIHTQVTDKIVSQGVSELVRIYPLDDIDETGLPETWNFNGTCMPKIYANRAKEYANFKVREDDIWVVTYPKCGTTWTQEMTWMIVNDMDFNKSNSKDITERIIFFELNGMVELESWDAFKALEEQKSPRVIKTHLPISLLPRDIWKKKCKIIYVTRDPKDVVVSFFHHFIGMTPYTGTIEEFIEGFLTDQFIYCSF
ncbi:estrogen sulfotransferase-like isoform X2 [Episyrphus balteatus]|nr:estrogen sulfotransferase-like isoform X2 [Episyrphus balteatus]